MAMRFIDADAVERALSYPKLIDVLEVAFRNGAIAPPRHHHTVPLAGRPEAFWLLMPAITAASPGATTAGPYMGMKSVTCFPDNGPRNNKPAVAGMYLLLSTETGETLAILDATRLTVWRTAAASALASRLLSRTDSSRLVLLGAGALAPYFIRAHTAVRPIREVVIWNRTLANAEAIASRFASAPYRVTVTDDLEGACRSADIVSAITLSKEPLIKGAWLKPGTHVDTAGAFTKDMRETDDDVVRKARLFADTMAGAFGEAGDFLQPIARGVIGKEAILGDLYDLTRGKVLGRQAASDITFFKSGWGVDRGSRGSRRGIREPIDPQGAAAQGVEPGQCSQTCAASLVFALLEIGYAAPTGARMSDTAATSVNRHETRTWQSGGGRRIVLAFAFLILLPFYASLGPMLFQRISRGFVGDTISLVILAAAFTALMALILQQLVHAVRTRITLDADGIAATVPKVGARGPFFLLGYDTRSMPYSDVAGIDQRNEVYGGSLLPVLLTSTQVVSKSGPPLVLGYTNASDSDPQFPFPEIGREIAARTGTQLTDHGTVHRSLRNRIAGIMSAIDQDVPLPQTEIDAINAAHRRNIRGLVAVLAVLVIGGISLDVFTASRTSYAAMGAGLTGAEKPAAKKK
jgi:ornithine cyclodeaminase/alanine dehydrogenase-like protein (mu-crystallin family)